MFRAGLLIIIRRINCVQTAVGIVTHYVNWLLAGSGGTASSQSTLRMTIPTAVYTQLILLMMISKPARNM
jgi:hypothetical protein